MNVNYARVASDAAAGKTIPFWSSQFTYLSTTYPFTMVGTDPSKGGKGITSKVTTVIYAYVLKMSDGTVFDPTKPACGDTESVITRFEKSPLYADTPITENGASIGKVQYEDAMQRGEFWKYTQIEPNYHVILEAAKKPVVVKLNVPANEGGTQTGGSCGKWGTVDINWLSQQVNVNTWKANTVPVVFMYDIMQTSGGCCIGGYHGAFTNGKGELQTYSVATYNDPGIVSIWQDITVFSHEYGELLNDPTGNNGTPLWGNIGQVSGCQNNLEVGDPLTGTDFPSINVNGMTYHPQELAYYSWFSHDIPSLGAGGSYSMNNTFVTPAAPCT